MASNEVFCQTISLACNTYLSTYDTIMMVPRQVSWVLHKSDLGLAKRNPSWQFINDLYSFGVDVSHSDYNRSGFHRGHMCPAADRSRTIDMMKSTFTMSNICPQRPSVNTGYWLQTERWCRQAAMKYDSVMIMAVPVFMNCDTIRIGDHHLAVPHAFFKACWLPKNDSVINCWFIFNHDWHEN